jgi:hypothetical protein
VHLTEGVVTTLSQKVDHVIETSVNMEGLLNLVPVDVRRVGGEIVVKMVSIYKFYRLEYLWEQAIEIVRGDYTHSQFILKLWSGAKAISLFIRKTNQVIRHFY